MAYAVTNPPSLVTQRIGDGPALWIYKSTDAKATVVAASYITNAGPGSNSPNPLGMRVGDFVMVYDSTTPLGSFMSVTAISATTGAASLSYVANA